MKKKKGIEYPNLNRAVSDLAEAFRRTSHYYEKHGISMSRGVWCSAPDEEEKHLCLMAAVYAEKANMEPEDAINYLNAYNDLHDDFVEDEVPYRLGIDNAVAIFEVPQDKDLNQFWWCTLSAIIYHHWDEMVMSPEEVAGILQSILESEDIRIIPEENIRRLFPTESRRQVMPEQIPIK